MRVRSRQATDSRRRSAPTRRFAPPRDTSATPVPEAVPGDDLADEHRLRASGGPHDRAQYACGCGFVWQDDVSASVTCPHCGTAQAW